MLAALAAHCTKAIF
jgi:hypothetical protein